MRQYLILQDVLAMLEENSVLANMAVEISTMTNLKHGGRAQVHTLSYALSSGDHELLAKHFGPNWDYIPVVDLNIGHANLAKELRIRMVVGTLEDVIKEKKENAE